MTLPASAHVPGGVDVHDGLARLCAGAGVTAGMLLLAGDLEAATLAPAPGAAPLILDGPLYLVSGTAVVRPEAIEIFGVLSWTDQGLPRLLAGRLEAAVSGGLAVGGLASGGDDAGAPDPGTRLDLGDALPPTPRRAARHPPGPARPRAGPRAGREPLPESRPESRARRPAARHFDGRPPAARRPAAPARTASTGGGWAAAVAASKQAPTRPREQPRPMTSASTRCRPSATATCSSTRASALHRQPGER
ncbi:MAG: hypothetical protein R3F60_32520 [bacterium]